MDVLILGCGFTGQRVAQRFLTRGAHTIVTTRDPERLEVLSKAGAEVISLEQVPKRLRQATLVLHSIPPPPRGAPSLDLRRLLGDDAARVVYLSSTAVYGAATIVDETTPVDSSAEFAGDRTRSRLAAEDEVATGPWGSLILRPAAIYGPGRGVQESFARGEYNVGDNYVSRIHVDDLAAHVEAALLCDLTGAYPVADEEPCTSREAATFCAELLGIPPPDPASIFVASKARVTGNRRVDGSAIRGRLGITLQYPSYRTGFPACLQLN